MEGTQDNPIDLTETVEAIDLTTDEMLQLDYDSDASQDSLDSRNY